MNRRRCLEMTARAGLVGGAMIAPVPGTGRGGAMPVTGEAGRGLEGLDRDRGNKPVSRLVVERVSHAIAEMHDRSRIDLFGGGGGRPAGERAR